MFSSFPHALRRYGLHSDVRNLMDLYRLMELGLVSNLGTLYEGGRYLICKSRRDFAPYTLAFWDHFLGIDTTHHRTIDASVRDSEVYEHWLSRKLETGRINGKLDHEKLIDEFLNDVLQSGLSSNIQKEIEAREHLSKDNPEWRTAGHHPLREPSQMSATRWWTIPEFHSKNLWNG